MTASGRRWARWMHSWERVLEAAPQSWAPALQGEHSSGGTRKTGAAIGPGSSFPSAKGVPLTIIALGLIVVPVFLVFLFR